MKSLARGALALLVLSQPLVAQGKNATPMEVKTIELRHLTPGEAVKLLAPYVRAGGGGVFDVSGNLPIITIRDVAENIPKMEAVLAKYDHQPATIRLVFELIEADTVARAIVPSAKPSADFDLAVRGVLKFTSYRLLSQGVASAGEYSIARQGLASGDSLQQPFSLTTSVGPIRLTPAASIPATARGTPASTAVGTVRLGVSLMASYSSNPVMETQLDVPLGHMVVLGTAVVRNGRALILTVRPELVDK